MHPFRPDMTIIEAKDILRNLAPQGHECPVCTQFVKVYRRKVNSSMARGLIAMWRAAGLEFVYVQDLRLQNGQTDNREESKLRYWGLVEEEPSLREDGGRPGWWRVTPKGRDWVLRRLLIPKYARLYNGRCLGFDGDPVGIDDALGTKFRYDDLMAGI